MKRVEKAFSNHIPIMIAVLSMAAIYNVLAIIIWQATDGLSNAIDDTNGLPMFYDIFLVASIILLWITAITVCRSIRIWRPRQIPKDKSRWTDKLPRKSDPLHPALSRKNKKARTPGPPASKHAD